MKKNDSNLTKEELNLIEETEQFMKEVEADPEVKSAELPADLYEKVMGKVREKEETEELVRLGRIYKKRRKARKYWVIAAAAVLVLGFGVTAVGNKERISEIFHFDKLGRDQTQVNSGEGTIVVDNVSEEEVYQQIEDEYGFYPVVMLYKPQGINFVEAHSNPQTHMMIVRYGEKTGARIILSVYPAYLETSYGIDIEDEMIEYFTIKKERCEIGITKYRVEGMKNYRWVVTFKHQNIRYLYQMEDFNAEEVIKVVENLKF